MQKVLESDDRAVRLSDDNLKKNMTHHAEMTPEEYRHIPQMIAQPEVVLHSGENHILLLSRIGKQLYRLIVKKTLNRKENWLLSLEPTSEKKALASIRNGNVLLDLRDADGGE